MNTTRQERSNYSLLVNAIAQARHEAIGANNWGHHQYQAWLFPRQGPEAMLKSVLMGWVDYADQYHQWEHGSARLSQDYYTGPYWLDIGKNIIGLLSNDRGRFDGGTICSLIRDVAYQEGFTPEDLD